MEMSRLNQALQCTPHAFLVASNSWYMQCEFINAYSAAALLWLRMSVLQRNQNGLSSHVTDSLSVLFCVFRRAVFAPKAKAIANSQWALATLQLPVDSLGFLAVQRAVGRTATNG